MPRYYFHLKSPTRPVRDKTGVELSGLEAAHWHAMRLAYRLREHAAETGEDWVIAVADETGGTPLVILPSAVPMLRAPAAPPEHLNFLLLSPLGRGVKAPQTLATSSPRCRPALTASAPGNPEPRP